jgi:predicted nuclease of predicted toxin-antitoxin system
LKLLFDNNLSIKLPSAVVALFPESKHVSDLAFESRSDRSIFDFAGKNGFTIVTKDKDFYHLVNTLGPPPKIVWLSVGNCTNEKVLEILSRHQPQVVDFIKSSRSLFVIN